MPNATETLARHLIRALYNATDGRPQRWRSLAGLSDLDESAAAVNLAVDRGWMLIEGGHSVALTDSWRELAKE